MPVARPSKEFHPLCHEHHQEMRPARIDMMLDGKFMPTRTYACPVSDCLVHYAASRGYFLATEHGHMELDSTPRLTCPHDGQPMYLAEINPEVRSFRLWRCPQCHARCTNKDNLIGQASR
jgi:hypothetical protein